MRFEAVCVGAISLALLFGCGDPATSDRRGYTKAPLERPGLIIRTAEEHPLEEFARRVLPMPSDQSVQQPSPTGS